MLTHAIALFGILFIIAILLSALLIGLFFTVHAAFLQGGFSPPVAMLMISIITFCIIGMLVMLAQHFARQLPCMLASELPITARISDTIHSFMGGYMEK